MEQCGARLGIEPDAWSSGPRCATMSGLSDYTAENLLNFVGGMSPISAVAVRCLCDF